MAIKDTILTIAGFCRAAFALVRLPKEFNLEDLGAPPAKKDDPSAAVVGATPEIFGLPTVPCSGDGSGVALAPEFR